MAFRPGRLPYGAGSSATLKGANCSWPRCRRKHRTWGGGNRRWEFATKADRKARMGKQIRWLVMLLAPIMLVLLGMMITLIFNLHALL